MENRVSDFRFPVDLPPGRVVVGIHEVTFNRKSLFFYRYACSERGNCFFIRKTNFKTVIKKCGELGLLLKNFKFKIVLNFLNKIYLPIKKDEALILQNHELYSSKLKVFFKDKVEQLQEVLES